jgi:hypothetical protein
MKDNHQTSSRRCPRCQCILDISQFYADRSKASGRKSHCKECSKTQIKDWKSKNPARLAEYERNRRKRESIFRKLEKTLEKSIAKYRRAEARTWRGKDHRTEAAYLETFDQALGTAGYHLVDNESTRVTEADRKLNGPKEWEGIKEVFWECYDLEDTGFDSVEEAEEALLEWVNRVRVLCSSLSL